MMIGVLVAGYLLFLIYVRGDKDEYKDFDSTTDIFFSRRDESMSGKQNRFEVQMNLGALGA